ncbi:hypothetical protein CR513_33641, partial [Mucuna pruriens]
MAIPPLEEAITPFIICDLGAQHGGYLKNIQLAWISGPKWGLRSYKAWLWDRLEQASLTFEDPRLSANGEPHSSNARLHSPLKQKLDDSPKHPSGQGANKKACRDKTPKQALGKPKTETLAELIKERAKTIEA